MCFPILNNGVYPPGMGDQETLLKSASLFNPRILEPISLGLTVPMIDGQGPEAGTSKFVKALKKDRTDGNHGREFRVTGFGKAD
jgi:hypothetical protein